jgi:hemolysin activation/secretion protein
MIQRVEHGGSTAQRVVRFFFAGACLLVSTFAVAQVETPRFPVERFDVRGNTLLPQSLVDNAVRPFLGKEREYGDLQRALEAVELLFRTAGYSAVLVHIPEQELTDGVVRIDVTESRLKKVEVTDNAFFTEENIRRSLPNIKEGTSPNATAISANVQLANENPAKVVDVTLRAGEQESDVDVGIKVTDSNPRKVYVTLDNTGNEQTGNWRTGIGLQHANVFNRDHVVTLNYMTAPEKLESVDILSVSYRVPLYSLGHSIDVIAAKSDVDAGSTNTVAGPLSFAGKGDIFGLRYNWLLPRRGVYTHRIVAAWDYKAFKNSCSLGAFGPAGCGAAGVNITDRPVTLTYAAQYAQGRYATDFSVGYMRNIPGGGGGKSNDFAAARPSPLLLGGARAEFSALRLSGSYTRALENEYQIRVATSGQYTNDPLISAEQFGIAGSSTVRGFMEREVARDIGYYVNTEIYTPNIAEKLRLPGALRVIAFYDFGWARNNQLAGELSQRASVASIGTGVRWNLEKTSTLRFDLARIVDESTTRLRGRYRGHIAVMQGF